MLPPGPREPAAVTSLRFVRRPMDVLLRWHAEYGDVFTVKFLVLGTGVYVADPAAIKAMFTGDQSDLRAGEANAFLEPVLGPRSVLVLDGPEHLRQRRLLLPPFGGPNIAALRGVIRDVADREIDTWRRGERFALRPRMQRLTFEVIARVVFGVTEPARVERLRAAFARLLDRAGLMLFVPPAAGVRILRRGLQEVDALLADEIVRRRQVGDLEARTDVLSLLLRARDEDGQPLTDGELRDELVTMLAAGHETTATGLAFAIELLLHHPGERARLREDPSYAEAVVHESLRLKPVIDAAERTLAVPRTVAGWDLPAGMKVYPAIALVHRREDLYPDAAAFRPQRFHDGTAESYSWLPFGGGIRRCIGASLALAEMAEVLRAVAERTDLRALSPQPDPVVLRSVTMAPRHGVRVELAQVRPAISATSVSTVGHAMA